MPDIIIQGMEKMPPRCRECFAVQLWDEMDYCQIAERWQPWDAVTRPDWCPLRPAPEWISEFYCDSYRAERNYAGGIGICIGTKECEACSCNGEKRKCNFYPALKVKAEQLYSATRKNNTSYNGKEVARMRTLRARSDKELGICLRMLYAERVGYRVSVVENNKHKIEFEVRVDVDEALADVLEERFRILVS